MVPGLRLRVQPLSSLVLLGPHLSSFPSPSSPAAFFTVPHRVLLHPQLLITLSECLSRVQQRLLYGLHEGMSHEPDA